RLVDVLDLRSDVGVAAEGHLHRRAAVEVFERLGRLVDLLLLLAELLDLVLHRLLLAFESIELLRELFELAATAATTQTHLPASVRYTRLCVSLSVTNVSISPLGERAGSMLSSVGA